MEASDFLELPLTLRHAEQLTTLAAHHTDPFDRMLIAQAQVEAVSIVTHDRQFEPYGVPIVWV